MEQQKTTEKNKMSRLFKGMLRGLMVLLLAGLVYIGVVLLETPEARQDDNWAVLEEEEPVSPLQAATSSDVHSLARLFGAPLPAFSGISPRGEARNVTHDGKTVRQITLQYDGAVITALRPASAAPLLLQEDLSLSLISDLSVANMPAVLAEKDGRFCLYFSSNQAAYSITGRASDAEDFLRLIRQVTMIQ